MPDMCNMLISRLAENQNVVQIDENELAYLLVECHSHGPLKGRRCVDEAEWHHYVFIQAFRRDERRLCLVPFCYAQLMICSREVN